jgi:hypothetical protein
MKVRNRNNEINYFFNTFFMIYYLTLINDEKKCAHTCVYNSQLSYWILDLKNFFNNTKKNNNNKHEFYCELGVTLNRELFSETLSRRESVIGV